MRVMACHGNRAAVTYLKAHLFAALAHRDAAQHHVHVWALVWSAAALTSAEPVTEHRSHTHASARRFESPTFPTPSTDCRLSPGAACACVRLSLLEAQYSGTRHANTQG